MARRKNSFLVFLLLAIFIWFCFSNVRFLICYSSFSSIDHQRIYSSSRRISAQPEAFLHQLWKLSYPTIYAITPTYARLTQKADLTRLLQTLLHVPNFHWIVVEDSLVKTQLVGNLLKESGMSYTHLNARTRQKRSLFKFGFSKRNKVMPRGVDQRNAGLAWLRKTVPRNEGGVLYFMDDDNTYSLRVFEEMRSTKIVSCWLVGFLADWKFEGPGKCKDGQVYSWFVHWHNERKIPLDMAAFAINLELIYKYPTAYFSNKWPPGNLESMFLESLKLSIYDMEGKANCTEVLAWHTKTAKPSLDKDFKLNRADVSIKKFVEV